MRRVWLFTSTLKAQVCVGGIEVCSRGLELTSEFIFFFVKMAAEGGREGGREGERDKR